MAPSVGQMEVKSEMLFPKPCVERGEGKKSHLVDDFEKQNGKLHSICGQDCC